MCHTKHIIHIWMLTPVFLLGIKHQEVPHRAYSDDSDAHRFCVSRHHGSGAKVLSLNPDISDT